MDVWTPDEAEGSLCKKTAVMANSRRRRRRQRCLQSADEWLINVIYLLLRSLSRHQATPLYQGAPKTLDIGQARPRAVVRPAASRILQI